jgi:hypothetical protein
VTTTIALPDDPDRLLRVIGNLEEVVASEYSRRAYLKDIRLRRHEVRRSAMGGFLNN